MVKIDKHIEIVSSSASGFKSLSKKSYDKIQEALSKYYTEVGVTLVGSEADLKLLVQKKPDMVFLGVKRVPNADSTVSHPTYIWLADFLESNHISHTGSNTRAHQFDHAKNEAKDAVKNAGLATADYFLASKGQFTNQSQLPLDFPLFIKPPSQGGGAGIGPDSVVHNFEAFTNKVNALHDQCASNALVEEYLPGREFTVGILRATDSQQLHIMPLEMLPEQNALGDRIIGREMKGSDIETPVSRVPDGAIKDAVMELARNVFMTIGARDYGRIDIRLDKDGLPRFLEANLIPGLINKSGNFQKACVLNLGLDYEPMLLQIVDLAMQRSAPTKSTSK